MKHSIEILDELNSISPFLAGLEKRNVYSVPDSYFGNLLENIIEKKEFPQLNTANQVFLNGRGQAALLPVPATYFDNLPAEILNKINIKGFEEVGAGNDISPIINAARLENPFVIPSDYFDGVAKAVLKQVKPEARVIRMERVRSLWQLGRAAVITGVIAVSALMVYDNQHTFEDMSAATELQQSHQYKNEQQIIDGISKLPEEEIIKYLETNVSTGDNESLSNTVDEEETHLSDDKTKDNNELNKLDTPGVSK